MAGRNVNHSATVAAYDGVGKENILLFAWSMAKQKNLFGIQCSIFHAFKEHVLQ